MAQLQFKILKVYAKCFTAIKYNHHWSHTIGAASKGKWKRIIKKKKTHQEITMTHNQTFICYALLTSTLHFGTHLSQEETLHCFDNARAATSGCTEGLYNCD